jgi:hypothetical protein
MSYVLIFITGRGERSIDQGMMIVEKGYSNDDHDRIIAHAKDAGIDGAEIVGVVDVPDNIARDMGDWRMYIG